MEKKGMNLKNLKFQNTEMPKGIQAILKFGDHELSIVKSDFSYGGKQGLYEIAVFKDSTQIEMPGITQEGDTVKGFLNESDVDVIIKKMHIATGSSPSQ